MKMARYTYSMDLLWGVFSVGEVLDRFVATFSGVGVLAQSSESIEIQHVMRIPIDTIYSQGIVGLGGIDNW